MVESLEGGRTRWLIELRIGDLAYQRGDFSSALTCYQTAHRLAEKLASPEYISIALVKTAICFSALSRMDEAEKFIRDASSLEAQSVLNGNDAGLLHHEYSVLLFRLGRFAEGLREETKALEFLNTAENPDCHTLVLVLKQLAVYMTMDKEFEAADSFLEDATRVALSASTLGKDSLLYGQILVTKAVLRIDEHRFDEARELYERAIFLVEMHEGQFNTKVADLYKIIAKHLADAGETSEAERFLNRAKLVSAHNRLAKRTW